MFHNNKMIFCKKSSGKFRFVTKTIPFDPAGGVVKQIHLTEFKPQRSSLSQMKNQFAEAWCLD